MQSINALEANKSSLTVGYGNDYPFSTGNDNMSSGTYQANCSCTQTYVGGEDL